MEKQKNKNNSYVTTFPLRTCGEIEINEWKLADVVGAEGPKVRGQRLEDREGLEVFQVEVLKGLQTGCCYCSPPPGGA